MKTTLHIEKNTLVFDKIMHLRYLVLRAPWNQNKESATDDQEKEAYNGYILDEKTEIIACARMQENEFKTGQIRFMAVATEHQGKGFGKQIILAMEEKAKALGLEKMELHARENALAFYKSMGYKIEEKVICFGNKFSTTKCAKTYKS